MASNFEVKTGADLVFNTLVEYILTTDDVEGDPADLVDSSLFGGKINQVLQEMIDNLNYLKDGLDNVGVDFANQTEGRSGTNIDKAMNSLRVLDALRNGGNFAASTTRKGTSERATQAEVNTGTDTGRHLTPDTFNDSDAIQSILPDEVVTITHNTSSSFTVSSTILGNIAFITIEATANVGSGSFTNYFNLNTEWQILHAAVTNASEDQGETNFGVGGGSGVAIELSATDGRWWQNGLLDTNDRIYLIAVNR